MKQNELRICNVYLISQHVKFIDITWKHEGGKENDLGSLHIE